MCLCISLSVRISLGMCACVFVCVCSFDYCWFEGEINQNGAELRRDGKKSSFLPPSHSPSLFPSLVSTIPPSLFPPCLLLYPAYHFSFPLTKDAPDGRSLQSSVRPSLRSLPAAVIWGREPSQSTRGVETQFLRDLIKANKCLAFRGGGRRDSEAQVCACACVCRANRS